MQEFGENIQQVHNEKLGRHLVAAINIEPGDTILEERPLLVAPHWECHQLKCAQCLQESYVMCRRCQVFPLCMDCSQHDEFDCEFFTSGAGKAICKDILVKNYGICGLLKLLLLLENSDTRADCQMLIDMPINLDEYRDGEGMWQEHEEQVVRPIMQSGFLDVLSNQQLSSDELHAHCIRIDSNSFEVTARDGDTLKGVFVCGASLPHHCVPNTVVALDEQFNMKLYAAVPLQPGDIIYNSYTNPLMGTSQRQHQLRLSRRFECTCSRCLDPTEMGTHMSSMKCRECEGYSVCEIDSNGRLGDWRCPNCNALLTAAEVHELQAEVGSALVEARGDLQVYEALLNQYGPLLHPNHFMLLDIKQNIASILRAAALMNSMEQPCKKLLARRVELCSDLLPVCRAVVPGISKLYAIGLFEYLLALVELVELQFAESDLDKKEYVAHLRTASMVAKEAIELLRFEPENSAEGYLSDRISMELERIESDLKKYGR
ncbi:SET domain-containing protein SmydA-8 [Drosophila eugracilis]|uniref:SET domain-containing protein SmydA-8 n=1 Tax=Drosophila eugracilis TaxID=29029 RepID=UPI0007E79905|nr:SET domain-containing protein SmydA-8 [Drosophila eugracilis]XP_017078483.1 SET domain-containing protein SmydA-8 [Drosophila eugracilis]